jgi:hypothetical protein
MSDAVEPATYMDALSGETLDPETEDVLRLIVSNLNGGPARQEFYVRRDRLAAALHLEVPLGEVFESEPLGAEPSASVGSQGPDGTNRRAWPTTLAEIMPHLRLRRGMVLTDSSFGSLSSYIGGFALASGELPHREFAWWLCDQYGRHRGPVGWEWLIANHVGFVRRGWSRPTELPDWEREAAACEELLDRVEQYLAADASVHEELRDAVDKKFAPRDPSIDS